MKHLSYYNISSDCQHGFRAKRSTQMQLILTLQAMAEAIQSSSIHVIVLEFAKAFDKVPHRHLLMNLQHYVSKVHFWIGQSCLLLNIFNQLLVKAKRQANTRWLLVYPSVQSSAHCCFYYICKRLARQCAIISKALWRRCFTLPHCHQQCGLWPSSIWPTQATILV